MCGWIMSSGTWGTFALPPWGSFHEQATAEPAVMPVLYFCSRPAELCEIIVILLSIPSALVGDFLEGDEA